MLFVLPGFLVYLYSGASVFTAAQKSHPLMRTFVMCFSNGCQNPNNIYWKQRQIHGEIHGQGVDDRPDCEFWWRKTSGTFWQQAIAEKTPQHWVGVVCLLRWCAFLFTDLLYCLLHNVTFPQEYFVPRRIFPICCQKFPLTANLTIVEKVHKIIPIRNIFVPRLSI